MCKHFVTATQVRSPYLNGFRTCSYLIGNKGTHISNGNPRDEVEKDPGEVTLKPDTLALIKENVQGSIGVISTTSRSGTGFRVGKKSFMTAYHVLEDAIDNVHSEIMYNEEIKSEKDVETLISKLGIKIEKDNTESISMAVKTVITKFLAGNCTNVLSLLDKIKGLVDTESVAKSLTSSWNQNCKVYFIEHGDYFVDWNIRFGDKEHDVVIVDLLKSKESQTFPLPMLLDENYRQNKDMYLIRYIHGLKPEVIIDQRTQVLENDTQAKRLVDEALQWWTAKFPHKEEAFFREYYARCCKAVDDKTGRVVLKASKSFTEGSSGSPVIYLFNKTSQPVVNMIYQGGDPVFYYKANLPRFADKRFAEFRDVKVDSKCLFERATTMKKVSKLLVEHGIPDLRNDIFSQPAKAEESFQATNVKSVCDRGTQDEGTADTISELETGIDAMDLQVKKWKQDDKMCYVTKAIHHALQKISVQNYLAVIGVPGSGKTTTIRHVALTLQEREGYIIYPLKQPFHFRKYLKKDKKQIFLIDDPVGEYVIQKKKLEMWDGHNEEIKDCLEASENTKFLTSLRVQLYEDVSLKGKAYIFNDPDHITNLGDGELKLETAEMKNMLRMYLKAKNVNIIEELINKIWWSTYQTDTQFAECFPLLCKVFTENEYARRDPARYFEDPFVALTKIFQRIKSENNIQFCGLVLCAMLELKDEHFSPYIETDDRDARNTAIKSLDLDPERSLKKIKEALKTLDNVYISHIGNDYVFSHSIFHSIVTFIYDDANFVFRHGRIDFLLTRVRINSRLPGDDEYVLVFSGEKNVELLVDRMIKELKINMWLGAYFVTQFYLMNDDKILSCLISKLLESNDADITDLMIHALFARCIECVWRHCKTHKEDRDESGWPCYKLLKILSERVDCNTQVMAGQYPIHLSVETGSLILAKLLINNKANVNQLDADRRSVLHYALKAKNNIEMTRYLLSLESLSCLNEVDSQQKTPYSYLLESDVENKKEIIAMYKERGACDLVENRVI